MNSTDLNQYNGSTHRLRFNLSENIDIEVQYYNPSVFGSFAEYALQFYAPGGEGSGNRAIIWGAGFGTSIYTYIEDNGVQITGIVNTGFSVFNDGRFRITYNVTTNLVTTYYWNGSIWVIGTQGTVSFWAGAGFYPWTVNLYCNTYANGSGAVVNWDNFAVNSGNIDCN